MSANSIDIKGLEPTIRHTKSGYTIRIPNKKTKESEWFIGTEFQHAHFAHYLMSQYRFLTMPDNEEVYVYEPEKGIYSVNGEILIKKRLIGALGEDEYKRYYTEVLFYIQGKTYPIKENGEPDKDFRLRNTNKIVTLNCVLNMDTFKPEDFSPDHFLSVQIPVNYKLGAECPKILKFIKEVVGEDQINLIQEWFGFCLYLRYFIHKSMMLVGEGANGKSTLLRLLERMLGKQNISDETLQDLCTKRFAPAQLFGKLANVCADIPNRDLSSTGMFKMLTGEDMISGEKKFKDNFSFRNYAKLIFSTNKVPKTKDETTAFFRRWIIITCNNVFPPGVANPKILDEICIEEELSGLLNWALEGIKRLLQNSTFSDNQTFEELRERYIKTSNSVEAYVHEHLEVDSESYVTKDDLYNHYRDYCFRNRLPVEPKNMFAQHLAQYIIVKVYYPKIGGRQVMSWLGIRVINRTNDGYEPCSINRKIMNISKDFLKDKEGSSGETSNLSKSELLKTDEVAAWFQKKLEEKKVTEGDEDRK